MLPWFEKFTFNKTLYTNWKIHHAVDLGKTYIYFSSYFCKFYTQITGCRLHIITANFKAICKCNKTLTRKTISLFVVLNGIQHIANVSYTTTRKLAVVGTITTRSWRKHDEVATWTTRSTFLWIVMLQTEYMNKVMSDSFLPLKMKTAAFLWK